MLNNVVVYKPVAVDLDVHTPPPLSQGHSDHEPPSGGQKDHDYSSKGHKVLDQPFDLQGH